MCYKLWIVSSSFEKAGAFKIFANLKQPQVQKIATLINNLFPYSEFKSKFPITKKLLTKILLSKKCNLKYWPYAQWNKL